MRSPFDTPNTIATLPNFSSGALDPIVVDPPAQRALDSLLSIAKNLEAELKGSLETVSASLPSFGAPVQIQVLQLGRNGDFIILQGVGANGEPITLVQHYTQVSMIFRAGVAIVEKKPLQDYIL